MATRTLKLTIAYDGTNYAGWQIQPDRPSVQSVMTEALRTFTGETIHIYAAGRTDAGVHAVGQVVSFTTDSPVPAANFRPALQTRLPDDIVIRTAEDVAPGFHAQFHAIEKTYRFVFYNAPVWSPFLMRFSVWQRARLDVPAMYAAVQSLVGTHDFRSLETNWPNRKTSIRTVKSAAVFRTSQWQPGDDQPLVETGDGPFVIFEITADGFLYNMVRTIAGSLVHIGRGKWDAEALARIVKAQDRRLAGETAPAHGLALLRVVYPPTWPE